MSTLSPSRIAASAFVNGAAASVVKNAASSQSLEYFVGRKTVGWAPTPRTPLTYTSASSNAVLQFAEIVGITAEVEVSGAVERVTPPGTLTR